MNFHRLVVAVTPGEGAKPVPCGGCSGAGSVKEMGGIMKVFNESRDFFLKILTAFYECLLVCVPPGYLASDLLDWSCSC